MIKPDIEKIYKILKTVVYKDAIFSSKQRMFD